MSAWGHTRPGDTLAEGHIPVEGRGDIDEEPEERVSGADLDDEMQFADESIRGMAPGLFQDWPLVGG
jgi:hypothetical protein